MGGDAQRQAFFKMTPAGPAGLSYIGPPIFSPDGKWYAFQQARALSTLYLATGLK